MGDELNIGSIEEDLIMEPAPTPAVKPGKSTAAPLKKTQIITGKKKVNEVKTKKNVFVVGPTEITDTRVSNCKYPWTEGIVALEEDDIVWQRGERLDRPYDFYLNNADNLAGKYWTCVFTPSTGTTSYLLQEQSAKDNAYIEPSVDFYLKHLCDPDPTTHLPFRTFSSVPAIINSEIGKIRGTDFPKQYYPDSFAKSQLDPATRVTGGEHKTALHCGTYYTDHGERLPPGVADVVDAADQQPPKTATKTVAKQPLPVSRKRKRSIPTKAPTTTAPRSTTATKKPVVKGPVVQPDSSEGDDGEIAIPVAAPPVTFRSKRKVASHEQRPPTMINENVQKVLSLATFGKYADKDYDDEDDDDYCYHKEPNESDSDLVINDEDDYDVDDDDGDEGDGQSAKALFSVRLPEYQAADDENDEDGSLEEVDEDSDDEEEDEEEEQEEYDDVQDVKAVQPVAPKAASKMKSPPAKRRKVAKSTTSTTTSQQPVVQAPIKEVSPVAAEGEKRISPELLAQYERELLEDEEAEEEGEDDDEALAAVSPVHGGFSSESKTVDDLAQPVAEASVIAPAKVVPTETTRKELVETASQPISQPTSFDIAKRVFEKEKRSKDDYCDMEFLDAYWNSCLSFAQPATNQPGGNPSFDDVLPEVVHLFDPIFATQRPFIDWAKEMLTVRNPPFTNLAFKPEFEEFRKLMTIDEATKLIAPTETPGLSPYQMVYATLLNSRGIQKAVCL